MSIRRLELMGKLREHPLSVVGPRDFEYTEGPTLDAPSLDALLQTQEGWLTPYCVDPEHGRVIFVETPRDVDLSAAPFFYAAQYAHACGLVAVPYDVVEALAKDAARRDGSVILVHSTGRCGSTVLSKAFAAVPGVVGISEPDLPTQLVGLVNGGDMDPALARRLLGASLRLLWHTRPSGAQTPTRLAVKFRSQVMELVAMLCAEFAEAKHIFLYRDALVWLSSRLRIALNRSATPIDDLERRRELEALFARLHPYVAQHSDPSCPMSFATLWTWCWVSSMERYLDLVESGFPILAARYEELRIDPIAVLHAVFDHCALHIEDWNAIHAVLARDAQEGTVMARDPATQDAFEMPPGAIEESRAIIQRRDRLRDPAVIVPHTVELSRLSLGAPLSNADPSERPGTE